MNEGVWVAIGAALGTIGAILTTWLAAHLDRKSKFPTYDKAVQPILLEMLSGEHKWRKLEKLSRVTGLTLQDTKDYWSSSARAARPTMASSGA